MCRKVITLGGRELETVDQLQTIVKVDDMVLEEPVQFSGVLFGDMCLCPIDLDTTFQRLNWMYGSNEYNDILLLEERSQCIA